MRKIILLALLLVAAYSNSFAYLTQGHFRWRNNDGTEKTATWKAGQDTEITISDNKAIRLRVEIYNAQTSTKVLDRTLLYATSVNGPWSNITNNSAINAFNFEGDNGYITNNTPTTQQITDPTYPFQPGSTVTDEDAYTDSISVQTRREYEWCIKPTSLIQANTTYYFKSSVGSDQTLLPSLTTTGTAFAAGPQPILSNGGFETTTPGWTTAAATGSAATFSLTTNALQVHGGSKALLVNVTNAGPSNSVTLTHSPVTLDTGTYMLRFWALAKQRNAYLDINLQGADNGTCHYQIYNRFDTTKNGWQMYQYPFKVSSQSPVTLTMNFNTATVYNMDDIEIVSTTTNPNIDVQDQYDWQNNFNATYGWLTGDNDNPVLLPDNRRVYVYNDSFVGNRNINSNVLSTGHIVNNLLVIQNGDQLSSEYGGSSGNSQNLFSPGDGNLFWNAGGIVENNLLKVVLIEINNSNYTGHTWIGTLNLPSLTINSLVKLPATINTNPNCVFADSAYDYLYFGASSMANEVHTVVGRVPAGQLDSQTAWQFYTGNGNWSTDFTQAANLIEGVSAGNVVKLGPNNYALSAVPNLASEIDVWFAQSPIGPWVNKTTVYNIPQEEGLLAYEGHLDPLGKSGVYTFSYSLYPFVTEPNGSSGSVAMQIADKTTYVPCYSKANLIQLSPFSGLAAPDSITSASAGAHGRNILIQFTTAESGHNHFQVNQSTDNVNWTTVATLAGTDTTSNGHSYQVSIPEPLNGQNYYQIVLFDEDNKPTYSKVKGFFVNENAVISAFTAQPGNHDVNIAFSTSTEYFNDHFVVQTSPDSLSWTNLTTVQGGGTLSQGAAYQYTDPTAISGIIYYRLQYYSNGTLVYSTVQKADTRPSMTLVSGGVQKQGSSGVFQLTIDDQVNNPGFQLQQSSDDVNWQTIKSVPGNGTDNSPVSYSYTNSGVSNGITYYRIGYYHLGVQTVSPVFMVNNSQTGDALSLNVYPNPGNANVSFDLKGYTGTTFSVTLTNLYGKQYGKQTFTVNADGHYTLPSSAAPGTYILNINGDNNLAKSSRVLVQ